MFSFMLGVLGSLLFWAIYIPASFVITILIAKTNKCELLGMNYLIVLSYPEKGDGDDLECAIVGFIILFVTWPLFLLAVGMAATVRLMGRLFLYLLSFCVRSVESKVPIIKVTFDKED